MVKSKLKPECRAIPVPVLTASIFLLPTRRPTPALPILGGRPTPPPIQFNTAPASLRGRLPCHPRSTSYNKQNIPYKPLVSKYLN